MSSMRWSTPSRRSCTKTLPLIPNEVYLDIFDFVESSDENSEAEVKRIMANLALVCRFFCAMALPRVFKSLEFSGKSAQDDAAEPGYATFCRMLIQTKEPARSLALHIKSCVFRDWLSPEPDLEWVFSGCLRMYTHALTRMENLESLSLIATPLTFNVLKVLASLRELKSLEIFGCRVDCPLEDVCRKPALQISTLIFHETPSRWTNDRTVLIDLFDTSYLRILCTDSWTLTQTIIQRPGVSILEELDLSCVLAPEDALILSDFLDCTPSILTLKLPKNQHWIPMGGLASLRVSALPKLRNVCCDSSLVSTLIPGRPVDSLEISGSGLDVNTISMIKRSTAAISTLSIPASLFFQTPLSQHFPQLKKLCLEFLRLEPFFDTLGQVLREWDITTLGAIRVLYLSAINADIFVDLQSQHKALTTFLVPVFPELVCMRFVRGIEWRRVEDPKSPEVFRWKPFILHDWRSAVQDMLTTREVYDFDECFAALSRTFIPST